MVPISGTAGSITIGATPVTMNWIGKFGFKGNRKTVTVGPHIGDATEYEVGAGLSGAFTIEGTIPSGGDAGQDALITAFVAGTASIVKLKATLGKLITFASPVFETLEIDHDGKGTHTIKASGKGAFTIAQDV
jgi:hypothetical protein